MALKDAVMPDFTIDPEFRDLLPSLTDDEYQRLQADINKNGCRDKLVVWKEWNILIDGHNRHDICTTLDLTYDTVEMSFHGRDEVKMWMFRNQLGRRNLTDFQRAEIALLMKPVVESQAKQRESAGRPKEGKEILPDVPKGQTRDIVGKIAGVSGRTIDKVEKILADGPIELIQQVRSKEKSIDAAYKEVTAAAVKPVEQAMVEPLGVGVECAHKAIACLKKIPATDTLRKRAFEIVRDWMKQNP